MCAMTRSKTRRTVPVVRLAAALIQPAGVRNHEAHRLHRTRLVRDGYETIHEAMSQLERAIGPHAGIFAYTGYASVDEIWSSEVERTQPSSAKSSPRD